MSEILSRLEFPRYLSFFNEGKLVLVRKRSPFEPWENISNTRHDITKILFFDPELTEFKPSEYKLNPLDLTIEVSIEDFCEKIEYLNVNVFEYKSFMEFGYPETLLFNILRNNFTLHFLNEKKIKLNFPKLKVPTDPDDVTPEDLNRSTITRSLKKRLNSCKKGDRCPKKVKLSCKFGRSISGSDQIEPLRPCKDIELNTRKYKLNSLNQGYWYQFSENSCKYVKVLGYFLWKCKFNDPSQQYPKSLYYYKILNILILQFESWFILYKFIEQKWTQQQVNIPPINLYEQTDAGYVKRMTPDKFNVVLSISGDVSILYRVNPEIFCVMVKYNVRTVWKSLNDRESAKIILYNLSSGDITLDSDKILLLRNDDKSWTKVTKLPNFIKLYSEDELGNVIPMHLEKWNPYVNSANKCIFTLEPDAKCAMVTQYDSVKNCDVEIWSRGLLQSYPKKIIFSSKNKVCVLEFDNYFIVSTLKDDEWARKEFLIPPIQLHKQDEKGQTVLMSREDYVWELINTRFMILLLSINEGVRCTEVSFKKTLLWNSRDKSPYFIIYSDAKSKLYLTFDTEIVTYKYKSRVWVYKRYKIPPIRLFTQDNRGNKILMNYPEYRVQLRDEKEGLGYYYVITQGECDEVRYENNLIWRKTDEKHLSGFTFSNGLVVFNFGIKTVKYKLTNRRWNKLIY
ncbi:hypothetical protein TpMuguga_02g00785 [Theileria parva strain Muguga]|uniref:Uncharacterized protein n=1 Tax=Theileria parva TaxID=5875 RepID=Q4N454_THEPA|nr:uncharacterized protein TpMuguga_02g00785 [Theileria parva strain Muguga]EAN33069.1 hypothetical protein TpMuguga_02g00785 [Theileria parva strain Muguga]|eukprot:XP_765352.1 hypothetical protein [Theileria parva strain Muguga]